MHFLQSSPGRPPLHRRLKLPLPLLSSLFALLGPPLPSVLPLDSYCYDTMLSAPEFVRTSSQQSFIRILPPFFVDAVHTGHLEPFLRRCATIWRRRWPGDARDHHSLLEHIIIMILLELSFQSEHHPLSWKDIDSLDIAEGFDDGDLDEPVVLPRPRKKKIKVPTEEDRRQVQPGQPVDPGPLLGRNRLTPRPAPLSEAERVARHLLPDDAFDNNHYHQFFLKPFPAPSLAPFLPSSTTRRNPPSAPPPSPTCACRTVAYADSSSCLYPCTYDSAASGEDAVPSTSIACNIPSSSAFHNILSSSTLTQQQGVGQEAHAGDSYSDAEVLPPGALRRVGHRSVVTV